MMPLYTLSQSTRKDRLSSESVADLNPGIALCSLVLVCTIESISSSLVLSLGIDGDFIRVCLDVESLKLSSIGDILKTVLCLGVLSRGRGGSDCPLTGGER